MAPSKKKGDPWRLSDSSVKLATELMQSGEFMETEIAVLSGISVRSVQTIARNFRRHGQATNACRKKPGRLNLLSDEVLDDLTEWLLNRPSTGPTYLNEVKQYLIEKFGVEASLTTIHRSLSNVGVLQTKSVWRKVPPKSSADGNMEHDSAVLIVEHGTAEPAGSGIDQSSISTNASSPTPPQPMDPQTNIFMSSSNPDT